MRTLISVLLAGALLGSVTQAGAVKPTSAEDAELAQMQRQLNQEVMEKPFFAEEPERVDAYIKEASQKNIKPLEYTGPHWRAGYTCHDMLRYSWHEYRNCSYYHHYYGRYYAYP